MRRGLAGAAVLVGLLVVLEVGAGWYAERSAGDALCGADVDLAAPVLLRVLAGQPVPFEARFDAGDLELLVPLPAAVSGVTVQDDRLGLETTAGVTVPAELRLDGGTITVTPTLGVLDLDGLALRYELGDLLPPGVVVGRLDVAGDVVVAAGDGDARELTAPRHAIDCVS